MQGRYLPLAVVYHKDYESAKRAFLLHHQLYLARGIVYLILMLLPFFELFRFRLGVMVKCQTPVETLMDLHMHSVGYPISIHGHLL
jgi:hypothetical protein